MHIVMFGDQHVESSGGAQVSMRLQRRFLERAGHMVTIVQPRLHARRVADLAFLDLPSLPVTLDREYGMTLPTRAADRAVDAGMVGRPPVDVVHVQGDFWGAILGHRFAARHTLPVVHTMHNRVDVGIAATTPFPRLALRVLNAWAGQAIRPRAPRESGTDGWAYLRRFGARAAAVTAPSSHFAHRLMAHHVRPGGSPDGRVDVVWNGIDDEMLDAAGAAPAPAPAKAPPRLVWVGRMSPEKRLLPFIDALADSGVAADVTVIGGGGQARAARRLVARRRPAARVTFAGRLPYAETLRRLAAADAVVQSSVGFETQGMTVFEAASLGTPAIVADPDIADELGGGVWRVGTEPEAFAAALRDAVADIDAGRAPRPRPEIAESFRQSSRTEAMIAVYERVRRR
ncbi:glycosyltransferase family 4 protein [Microbacterium kunmingense]|uniref:glycosyltransferase family 4 protein n=1 Tax=Microbacterium kunmingense TaxID=2915939 RepID=UPI003D76507B